MRPMIYIAGPFRGETPWQVELNVRSAERIGLQVAKAGGIPVIPHTMYRYWDGMLDDEFWLECGLRLLDKCMAIVMCPGWGSSTGSLAERAKAASNRKPIFAFGSNPGDSQVVAKAKLPVWVRSLTRDPDTERKTCGSLGSDPCLCPSCEGIKHHSCGWGEGCNGLPRLRESSTIFTTGVTVATDDEGEG